MATLFLVDAVFDSTNRGIKKSFEGSLTGNVSLSAKADSAISLFGSEIPIVSEYESIPSIDQYKEIVESVRNLRNAASSTAIVSAAASVDISGYTINAPIFGIDPGNYFQVCKDITIVRGDIGSLNENGVFLNSILLEKAETAIGRSLQFGEPVIFRMYVNGSFSIRKGVFSGVHSYISSNEALDRVILANQTLVRSLANYTMGFSSSQNDASTGNASLPNELAFDIDGLFSENTDSLADPTSALSLESVEKTLADTSRRDILVKTDDAAFSFILFSAHRGAEKKLISELRELSRAKAWDVRIQDWRGTGGNTALLPYAIQMIFFIGLGFVMLGAAIIIMNALVISVMERSAEIGTMRGLGASRGFIRKIFIAETMCLTLGASFAGIIVGACLVVGLNRLDVRLTNSLLITIFGGNTILPLVGLGNIGRHILIAFCIGAISWIYPVSLALKIEPANAMGKAE
jgi:putative ABC transport system permease protein